MRRLETNYSRLQWSTDGTEVTKTRRAGLRSRQRFRYELRVNKLLAALPPPLAAPGLIDYDVRSRALTFEAVPGEPLGPKYPDRLTPARIDAVAGVARQMRSYRPRRRWFHRVALRRRLRTAHAAGLLSAAETASLEQLSRRVRLRWTFQHGDLTARNVMSGSDGLALIDWEWAGLYPAGYDLAFFWYSLVDVPGGRERVERHVGVDERVFLLSALLVELWHLQWFVPREFRGNHLRTRDELLDRLDVR